MLDSVGYAQSQHSQLSLSKLRLLPRVLPRVMHRHPLYSVQHYSHDCESTMASAPEFPAGVQSYADRIKNDYPEREYSWFLDILRGKSPVVAILSGEKRISTIRIVDDMGATSRSEHFDAPKDTEVCQDFVDALIRPLPCTGLRLVIVHFSRIQDLNFAYVDALGSKLNLDPSFLIMHFERSRSKYDHWFRKEPHRCFLWSQDICNFATTPNVT